MLNIRPCLVANGPPPPSGTVGAGHAVDDTKGLDVAEVIVTLALEDEYVCFAVAFEVLEVCFGVLHVVVGAPRTTWISDRSARPITANEVRSFMAFENLWDVRIGIWGYPPRLYTQPMV